MTRQEAIIIAAPYFAKNKDFKELHITSDKQAFPVENHADYHAKSLDKQKPEVTKVTRDEVLEVLQRWYKIGADEAEEKLKSTIVPKISVDLGKDDQSQSVNHIISKETFVPIEKLKEFLKEENIQGNQEENNKVIKPEFPDDKVSNWG